MRIFGDRLRFLLLSVIVVFPLILLVGCSSESNGDRDSSQTLALSIIHVNDTHTHLDPKEADFDLSDTKIFFDMGGYAQLSTKIKELRSRSTNSLLLHAGDAIQGSLYGVKYEGTSAIAYMNFIGFDAMVVGNHEFDYGPAILAVRIIEAAFPVLGANVNADRDEELRGKIQPYAIKKFGGKQVGIIGVITPTTATSSQPGENVNFEDTRTTVEEYVSELETMGVNKIIALTHLGYNQDIDLAESVSGVDVIIGGHSHTLLGGPFDPVDGNPKVNYPTEVTNTRGEPVCVCQAWEYSKPVAFLNVVFDKNGMVTDCSGETIILANNFSYKNEAGELVPVDTETLAEIEALFAQHDNIAIVVDDPETSEFIAPYQEGVAELKKEVIGTATEDIHGGSEHRLPTEEYPAGCEVAPHVLAAMLQKTNENGLQVDIALQNAGSLRTTLQEGDITVADAYNCLPFSNTLFVLELSGSQIKDTLETAIGNAIKADNPSTGAFPYLSGARYSADSSRPAGSRVTAIEVDVSGGEGDYRPVSDVTIYRLVTNSYLANGGDGYDNLKETTGDRYDTGFIDNATFIEYVRRLSTLSPIETNVNYNDLNPFE
jgi:5'-nucleotidase